MKICPNCNNQLNDNTIFCDRCGTKLAAGKVYIQPQNYNPNQQTNGYQAPMQSNYTPKKKTGKHIGIVFACILILAIIGAVAQDTLQKESQNSGNVEQNTGYNFNIQNDSSGNNSSEVKTSNPEYDRILTEAHIVHFNSFFNMDTANFVSKLENGNVYCADYGYKNDLVLQMTETLYIPVSGADEAEKTELENTAKREFAKIENISCCTVEYKMSDNYLTVTAKYNNLDQQENYSALYYAGIIDANTQISMAACERIKLSEGAIKK